MSIQRLNALDRDINIVPYRPISQTVFMLSIAINRAEHVCATIFIKHNYMLICTIETFFIFYLVTW